MPGPGRSAGSRAWASRPSPWCAVWGSICASCRGGRGSTCRPSPRPLRQSGLSILPAITLVALAVGAILGHQTGSLLQRFDVPELVLLSLTYAVIMELVPILVGILVAGRAGVDLAVRQATLSVSGEVDGLLAIGIDPIQYTLGPDPARHADHELRLRGMGQPRDLRRRLPLAVDGGADPVGACSSMPSPTPSRPADLLEAIGKPLLFALLIALIATVNGTAAGRDPQGIGDGGHPHHDRGRRRHPARRPGGHPADEALTAWPMPWN